MIVENRLVEDLILSYGSFDLFLEVVSCGSFNINIVLVLLLLPYGNGHGTPARSRSSSPQQLAKSIRAECRLSIVPHSKQTIPCFRAKQLET